MRKRFLNLVLLLATISLWAQTTVTVTGGYQATSGVQLTWTASVTPSVTYKVYRSESQNGSYTNIASGVAATLYNDRHVQRRHSYWYELSAVDASNNESALTTAVGPAVIP